jgi:GNAT superfamily N-acetyltransferase
METTLNGRIRAVSNVKRKLATLLRIVLGKIFVCEQLIAFETSSQASLRSTVDEAKVAVRLAHSGDIPKLDRSKRVRVGKVGERWKARMRFKAGHLCFVVEKNGKILNHTWVCFHEAYVDELERKIQIESDSAYRYDEYTDPDYRGMGILPTVLMWSANYLFQNGIKEIYEVVSSNNFPSLRAHQKIGSRKMGEVTLIRLFELKRYRCKGETPRDLIKLKQMFSI